MTRVMTARSGGGSYRAGDYQECRASGMGAVESLAMAQSIHRARIAQKKLQRQIDGLCVYAGFRYKPDDVSHLVGMGMSIGEATLTSIIGFQDK